MDCLSHGPAGHLRYAVRVVHSREQPPAVQRERRYVPFDSHAAEEGAWRGEDVEDRAGFVPQRA
jgi:hypothetical protein